MSTKIKAIQLNCIRGIIDLPIELDGKHMLIKGENGTGKSSIVDGLEFFFTGRISHLEGSQTLSLRRHCPHVKKDSEETAVTLTFNPGNNILTRKLDSSYTIPEAHKDFFSVTENGTFLLRRAQLLEFIISKPADRFRVVGNIIGIDQLDETELNLIRVKEDLSAKAKTIQEKINKIKQDIKDQFKADITNEKDILSEINKIFKKYGLSDSISIEKVDERTGEMLKKTKSKEEFENSQRFQTLISYTKEQIIDEKLSQDLGQFTALNNKLIDENANKRYFEMKLLEIGKEILINPEVTECPLCLHTIDSKTILSQVTSRLTKHIELSKETSSYRELGSEILQKLQEQSLNLKNLSEKINSLEIEIQTKVKETIDLIEKNIELVQKGNELSCKMNSDDMKKDIDSINTHGNSINQKTLELFEKIGISDKDKEFLKDISNIEQLKTKYQEFFQLTEKYVIANEMCKKSEIMYTAFSECKKSKIQEIYRIIQSDIDKFYSSIHPDEPHTNIQLILNLGRRASTELKIDSFNREGEDPRGLTSEGHLDSLGLCIFLAFIKNFNNNCPLVVLDDVVSTVDAKHRVKICSLLFSEFKDNQLIITTHDNFWYEQITQYQRAHNMINDFVNLRITNWSIEDGPNVKPYKPRWERILKKIEDSDKSGAGNEGRKYLEWLLENMCSAAEAPVQFKMHGKYEIGDLLPPIRKRLKKIIDDEQIKKELEDLFVELDTSIILGNILSHNNPLEGEVSISDVKKFCEDIHKIHEKILCPNCKKMLKIYRDLKVLRCPNGKCVAPLEIKIK